MTKFVMLALVAFSLAACETATKDDVALRSDVGPATSHDRPVVRGPVVPDRVEPAGRPVTAPRVARVVPNPLSQTTTSGSAATASVAAPARAPQVAPATQAPAASTATEELQPSDAAPAPIAPVDAVLMQDNARTAEPQPSAPIEFLPKDLTPQKIEAMFGGMPFLLLAAIAAALVASFGLALRRPNSARNEYAGHRDNVDHLDDHREPYAA